MIYIIHKKNDWRFLNDNTNNGWILFKRNVINRILLLTNNISLFLSYFSFS